MSKSYYELNIRKLILIAPFTEEYYQKLHEYINEFIEIMKDDFCPVIPDNNLFYHYTDHQGAYGIINSSSFWATESFYLNDSSEGSYGKEILTEAINEAIEKHFVQEVEVAKKLVKVAFELLSTRTTRAYIVSFCEKGDLLSQWRGYAGGSGLALGLSKQFFTTSIEMQNYPKSSIEWQFYKVSYGNDAKVIAQKLTQVIIKEIQLIISSFEEVFMTGENLEIIPHLNTLSNICERFSTVVKHEGFSEESEWRLVGLERNIPNTKIKASSKVMIPFVEFDFPIDFFRVENIEYELITVKIDDEPNDELDRTIDGLNYLKEVIIGPTAHFERSKRAIEELIKINAYDDTRLVPQTDFNNEDNLRLMYNSQDLQRYRNNKDFEMPIIKKSITPLV